MKLLQKLSELEILKSFKNIFFIFLLSISLCVQSQTADKITHPQPLNKVDTFGRNYLQKWNGEIEFYLDDVYFEAMPDIEQISVHIAEAKALVDKRKFFPAIRLLKGITLCEKIGSKNKKEIKPDVYKTLNKLISAFQDKKEELEILTEPYGCYAYNSSKQKKLFVESKDFSYLFEVDSRFRYVFPNELYKFARIENEYNWKVSYFRIFLPDAEKEKTFEAEYFRYEKKIFYEPPSRIMFSIGQTFHKHTLMDKANYPDIWDARRGLSNSVKRGSQFFRKEISKNIYETGFNLNDQTQTRSYFGLETYRFANSKGLGIFLTCPSSAREDCISIWSQIK